jgi:type II secretory pathway pseudopilin PulG
MRDPKAGKEKRADQRVSQPSSRNSEGGYALVALLALLSIMALVLLSAVPDIRRQAQREREEEAIFRGEQVAEAIRLWLQKSPNRQPPTSIDELLEGVPQGTKKLQVLRPSAARDPLSKSGEWKLVQINSPELIEFQQSLMSYAGAAVNPNPSQDPGLAQLAGAIPTVAGMLNTGTSKSEGAVTTQGEDTTENPTGPFIGVSSRSRRPSIINYYGIDQHSAWIFTPFFR